ncbi:hypothetical protein AB3N60_14260 [Leptospira sp. WS39.C2]
MWHLTDKQIVDQSGNYIYLPGKYCLYILRQDDEKMCKECEVDCPISYDHLTFEKFKGEFIPIKVIEIDNIGYYQFRNELGNETIFYTSEEWRLYCLVGFGLVVIMVLFIFNKSNLGFF